MEKKHAEELSTLISIGPIVVYTCDAFGDFAATSITSNIKEQLGYEPAEFVDTPEFWASNIHPDDRDSVFEELGDLFEKHLHSHEYRFRHKDGSYRWMHDDLRLIVDDDGRPQTIVGYWTDVTKRVHVEKALEEAKNELEKRVEERTAQLTEAEANSQRAHVQLHEAIESIAEAFVLYDADDRMVLCNSKFTDLYPWAREICKPGVTFAELAMSGARAHKYPDAEGREEAWLAERIAQHNDLEHTLQRQLADGRWILVSNRPTSDGGIVGIRADITKQKMIEMALRESESRLNGIVENAPLVICMRDLEGRIVKSNRASDELVDRDLWPILGKTLFEIFPHPLAEKLAENDREVIECGEIRESDITILTPDGEREFHDIKFPIVDQDGEVTAVVVIGADNTERNRADRKLRRARERLADAVESMPNGFALFDFDERLILANSAYREIWPCATHLIAEGVSAAEIAGAVADGGGVKFPENDADEWVRDRMVRFRSCDGEDEHQMIDGRWVVALERKTKIGETVSIRIDVTDIKRAKNEVLTTRNRLIDAIESIEEAFALHDEDDRLVLTNTAFREIFHDTPHLVEHGIRFEDQVRERIEGGLIEDAIGREEEYIEERMNIHREGGTLVLKRHDGHWFRISERRTKDGGYVGIRADITEIKKAEDQLKLSEERFRIIAETAPLPVLITDKEDGTVRYASPRIVEVFGVTADELLGRRESEFYDDPDERKLVLDELNKTGRVSGYELRARRDDGSEFWASVSIAPITYEGRDSLLTCTADISLLKENESILRDNEARLRTVIDNVADGIAVINRSGEIITTNDSLSLIFGYQPEELVGSPVTMLMPETTRREHPGYINNFINTGNGKIIGQAPREVTGRHKDGSELSLELAVNTYSVGDQIFFVGALRNIGPRKQLEEQLLQTQKMEALGTLAGGVAHDLNNTLVPILGLSELVLDDFPPGSDARDSIEHIHNAALRASRLVKQILAFSRQEEAEIETLELSSALVHMLDLLRASIPATVNIERHIEDGSFEVFADETQLHQVIMNLCVNAAQAIGDRSGTITVTLDQVEIDDRMATDHPNLTTRSYARIRVGDDGSGIDNETLSRIFEPFFTTKGVGEGTGLGLAVVHGVIKRHGGEIVVDSELGKGTTFEIFLPLKA